MDTKQRQRALDPTQSFIVQAPAGSGKTELLTQRFLNLLSRVHSPEEILAITFTKKAASEMRDRIVTALELATHRDFVPESTHKRTTYELALSALKQNDAKNWKLLDNPNRLRIQTIDSFNSWLARQLPILSQFGSNPEIVNDADSLYQEAIQDFLSHLEENDEWSNAIEKLLIHLDNDLKKVEQLLIRMLKKRDQWLPYIMLSIDDPQLRNQLELNLQSVLTDTLQILNEQFTKHIDQEFIELLQFAARNIAIEKPDSPIASCHNISNFPTDDLSSIKYWLGISKLLLTEQLEWRKKLDKSVGFPASYKEQKLKMVGFLEKFYSKNELHDAFVSLNTAPMSCYLDDQWEILSSLHYVLKIIVAQLKLTFQQAGKIDYIENAQAALLALGDHDNPTDLALAIDYKVQHILVDEFQDTSHSQYRLIEKLVSGWQKNDGRTLFLVGDPMQSIYRFREADVGLFIRSREKGIGSIPLESLVLEVNFRSSPAIINWVNEHFKTVLPAINDISTSAISFCPSLTEKPHESDSSVTLHHYLNASADAQAEKIVHIIQDNIAKNPKHKIAILVRSRTHLEYIIPTLNKHNLPYQAIDIDPLTRRPVIQDLMALTKALLHQGDRIAWLAILRAPWCGLMLKDLLIVSQSATQETIWQRLQDMTILHQLSEDGQKRVSRITPVLHQKISDRRRDSLRNWIENTWQLLGGPACVTSASDLNDANTYFDLLDELDQGSDILDIFLLDKAIEKLYASHEVNDSLQIMTIHNAKGLEFDTVILPHLEAKAPYDEKQLLLWMERTTLQQENQLILAPIHATGDESDSIYDYIKYQQAIKADYEIGRLLYVAATRAKKQLHLLFSLTSKNDDYQKISPPPNSLLEKLWPAIRPSILPELAPHHISHSHESSPHLSAQSKKLLRLKSEWKNPLSFTPHIPTIHQKAPGFSLMDDIPKTIGVIIHKIIENICQYGTGWWTQSTIKQESYIIKQLLQLGVIKNQREESMKIISTAIHHMLNDAKGQWIFLPHHEAQNEFHLSSFVNQSVTELVIDRTFIDEEGIRWIIDYKSSHPVNVALEKFLMDEQQKYSQKMQNYYLAMRELDHRPIRLALYFPLVPAWYEWEPV